MGRKVVLDFKVPKDTQEIQDILATLDPLVSEIQVPLDIQGIKVIQDTLVQRVIVL
jgi:hypothetical protein